MRLAVIADIHGNMPALEAVLEDVALNGADQVVVAGDLVNGGPDSRACWDLVRSLGHPVLRGNHERYLFDLGTPAADPDWEGERFAPTRWSARQFAKADLEEMRKLPLAWRSPEFPDLLVVHASPAADNLTVEVDPEDCDFARVFTGSRAGTLVRGHVHVPGSSMRDRRTLVTVGSVGLPLDGTTTANYLIVERAGADVRFRFREVPYDVDEAVRRFRDSGMLAEAGPMAKLFLEELVTGRHQLTPFLRGYEHWSQGDRLNLADAVELYLDSDSR